MTAVLNFNLNDLDLQFLKTLKKRFGKTAEVEIRLKDKSPADEILPDEEFWKIIDLIDWSKKQPQEKLQPAINRLA
jgi:hypothetical protein